MKEKRALYLSDDPNEKLLPLNAETFKKRLDDMSQAVQELDELAQLFQEQLNSK